jgi:nicotinamide-nucleotide amidase
MHETRELEQLAKRLGNLLLQAGQTVVTAESCTGGGIARIMTEIPGSSSWFERGFVTYSNAAKHEMLGVPLSLIARHGAVSQATVEAMVEGAFMHSPSDWAVAVSGIAGPDGGTEEKPIGTVWLAWMTRTSHPESMLFHFSGNRASIREQATLQALKGLIDRVSLTEAR